MTIIVKVSSYLSIPYTTTSFNGGERRNIPQRFLTVEQIGNLLLTQSSIETFSEKPCILVEEDSFQTRTSDCILTNRVEARD